MPTKKQYKKRKAQGLCTSCGTVKVKKYLQCDTCREKQKNRKSTSQKRKEQDLCVKCGGKRDNDTLRCEKCRKLENIEKNNRRKKRKLNKLCVYCGGNLERGNDTTLCEKHKEKLVEIRLEKKSIGQCTTCSNLAVDGKTYCGRCLERQKTIRNQLKIAGFCISCRKPTNNDFTMCNDCLEKNKNNVKKYVELCKEKFLCIRCCTKPVAGGYYHCNKCLNSLHEKNLKLKKLVMSKYGNICQCCSEDELFFLSIDHINGGGRQHRDKIGNHLYNWLRRNNFPPGFQVLCLNCNLGRYNNKGICPHKGLINPTLSRFYDNKRKVLKVYGEICNCCKESEIKFLSIDHIFGGGKKHRSEINMPLYRWLICEEYPDGYQTLCINCNMAKYLNGKCPHLLNKKLECLGAAKVDVEL